MTAVEILTEARDFLSDPKRWCKGVYGRDKHRHPLISVGPLKARAVKCCAMGAIWRVEGTTEAAITARDHLNDAVYDIKHLPSSHAAVEFNDAANTKHEDLIRVFDDAIVRAGRSQW